MTVHSSLLLCTIWRLLARKEVGGVENSFLPATLSVGCIPSGVIVPGSRNMRTLRIDKTGKLRNQNAGCVAQRRKDEERKVNL
jgi:hypothetical protein